MRRESEKWRDIGRGSMRDSERGRDERERKYKRVGKERKREGESRLVPRPLPVFQCCTQKNGRAWYTWVREIEPW